MGKIAVVLICFSHMFAQSYPCCPRTFGTALVFVCQTLKNVRRQYLNKYFYVRPNTVKFFELFNSKNTVTLRKLCEFIGAIFSIVKSQ